MEILKFLFYVYSKIKKVQLRTENNHYKEPQEK